MTDLNKESQRIKKQMELVGKVNDVLVKDTGYMKYSVILKTIPKREVKYH